MAGYTFEKEFDKDYFNKTYQDYFNKTFDDYFTKGEYTPGESVKDALANLEWHRDNKNPGDYTSQWDTQIKEIMGNIMNRDKFTYDLNGDALYQQYKDKYIQQGKMAMGDAIGQASAMTGGYGNSYAQSVGQQAYQASLDNLNDIVPQLYQMALDKYNMEGQELYNQYGMLSSQDAADYGKHRDKVAYYQNMLNYYAGRYDSERAFDYGQYIDERDFVYDQYTADRTLAYDQYSSDRSLAYDQYDSDRTLDYNEYRAGIEKASSGNDGNGGNGGNGGNNTEGTTFADTLWNATGTYDDNGNPIFRNSEGKTQAFGQGVNPYTGTKNKDAKHGTFSNGYQPNNIGGTKLKNSGMSTNVTGKNQTIWQANGKYWLWRGDLNKYIEVDVSDLD